MELTNKNNNSQRCKSQEGSRSSLASAMSSHAFKRTKTPFDGPRRNNLERTRNQTLLKTFLMESSIDPRLSVDLYKCPGSGRTKERSPQYSFPK